MTCVVHAGFSAGFDKSQYSMQLCSGVENGSDNEDMDYYHAVTSLLHWSRGITTVDNVTSAIKIL